MNNILLLHLYLIFLLHRTVVVATPTIVRELVLAFCDHTTICILLFTILLGLFRLLERHAR